MEWLDMGSLRSAFESSMTASGAVLAAFLPRLLGATALLGVGWAVARLAELTARAVLKRLGLDRAGVRLRVGEGLAPAGISVEPSRAVARVVFWLLFLAFAISALNTLDVEVVSHTVARIVGFVPHLLAAGLILLLGFLGGRVARNIVVSAALAADLDGGTRLGAAAQAAIVLLAAVIAVEQLGVETRIIVSLLSVIAATLGLAAALALALGARPVVTHILAGHFLRQSLPPGGAIEVEGRRGTVERVGAVDTLLRDDQHVWSVPNGRLIELVVQR